MDLPNRRARIVVLLIVVGTLLASDVPAADADCVRAHVAVRRYNADDITVVSPHDCLVPTPWNEFGGASYEHRRTMPNGMPNGFVVGAWVPVP